MRKPAAFHTGNQWWRAAGFACWHLRSVRCRLRHQRLFFALLERLLVEFTLFPYKTITVYIIAPVTLTPAKHPGAADMQSAHIAVLDIAANKLYNKGYGAQAPYWRQDPP